MSPLNSRKSQSVDDRLLVKDSESLSSPDRTVPLLSRSGSVANPQWAQDLSRRELSGLQVGFGVIQATEPKKIDASETLALFNAGQVLCHAVENTSLDELIESKTPAYCKNLMESLAGEGVKGLSFTSLVPDHPVTTYRGAGILVNSNGVAAKLIAKGDANSCTADDGTLIGASDFNSIEDLQNFVKQSDKDGMTRPSMNEVKGDFRSDALKGLFFNTSPSPVQAERERANNTSFFKLSLLQQHIKKKFNVELPIFAYTESKGKMQQIETSPARREKVKGIIGKMFDAETTAKALSRAGLNG